MPFRCQTLKPFFNALVRRKYIDSKNLNQTKLDRCLTTFDLTLLGVGSTLGLGIYVLAGQAASIKAGPSVALSFLVAAVASVFAALCYAEFGARVPKAGSAYVYSYVTVGELMAFIIGWNLVLEYVIGTASVARGYSGYLDSLFDGAIAAYLTEYMPMYLSGLSKYPDFLSLAITLLLTVMLAIGVKESTRMNNLFTGLNLLVVVYAVITGSFKADVANWQLTKAQVGEGNGEGGFLPYGFSGMMAGAAMCFYGYVGFDCIATTGEEVRNPQKAIPISILTSLLIVFLAYFGISTVQTLMWPYYDQNQPAPLPYVFKMVGWPVARWIISIGALAGFSTSLLGGMFPLPRVLYAMAKDGLIFKFLATVHNRFKTPLIATIISGVFAGCMAMMFDVTELAAMMSIGTLLAYSLVAVSVLILRYRILDERIPLSQFLYAENKSPVLQHSSIMEGTDGIDNSSSDISPTGNGHSPDKKYDYRNNSISASTITILTSTQHYTMKDIFRFIFNLDNADVQSTVSSQVSIYLIGAISFMMVVLDGLLVLLEDELFNFGPGALFSVCVMIVIVIVMGYALYRQPMEKHDLSFKVPYVPLVPILSIFMNIYLMMKLSKKTWIRFAVWMVIGFLIYFLYGIRNSIERNKAPPILPSIYENPTDTEEDVKKSEHSPLLTAS